jgi:diguanylate cyclase (GGDEF)-like protein/hemerythrin-like metal-binding protein/PAS domain S-box-containing protein
MNQLISQQTLDIFPWSDAFNTGVAKIDEQHKELVRLLNLLAKKIAVKSNIPHVYNTFDTLVDYAVYHFRTEEQIWDKHLPNDPLTSDHKENHKRLVQELEQLKSQLHNCESMELIESLLPFITRWLLSHILESDQYLATIVLLIESGLSPKAAKEQTDDEIHGRSQLMSNAILSIFSNLSNNTFRLMQEISEREQLKRIEDFRNEVMTLLANNASLNEILEKVVIGVEQLIPESMCAVLQFSEESEVLAHLTGPHLPSFFYDYVMGTKIGIGSCETAANSGQRAVSTEISSDRQWNSYQSITAKAGIKSSLSQPIFSISSNQVIGTFAIYNKTLLPFSENNIQLIEQSSKLISIAIEQAYNQQQLQIAATAFQSQEGVIIADASGVIIKINKAYTEITGYTAKDILGKKTSILKSGRQEPGFYQKMWAKIKQSGYWSNEVWNKKKDGSIYAVNLTITAVYDADNEITHYVGTVIDISERKESEAKINRLAFYDSLTQLPNRRLLLDKLNQAIEAFEGNRTRGEAALLFLDIDNFKMLNDMHGHELGDVLLQKIANRLEFCVGSGGIVGRLGGDEFVIILEQLKEGKQQALSEINLVTSKILEELSHPYELDRLVYESSISIGVTTFSNSTYDSSELMKQADIAMYQAKNAGRNTVRFFDPDMQRKLSALSKLERELRNATSREQFELFYQVQVDDLNQPVGAEALIRWRHPSQGVISPLEFIPLAEKNGLILPIGKWVIDQACQQLALWQENKVTADLTLAVNVSSKQIGQKDFSQLIKAAVTKHEINPNRLKIELTESLLQENLLETAKRMKECNDSGINFSLDDFGTGYSSLQYLKKLSFYQLKIDQSFIRDCQNHKDDQAILLTILGIAKSLNLVSIAEGVETLEQLKYLKKHGCQQFQGYLFSKPIPIAQFTYLIENWDSHTFNA